MEKAFLRRVRVLLLIEDYESVALHYDELDETIERAFARARAHGLRQERSLTAFIRLWFTIGPEFDRHRVVARYLGKTPGTPDDRFDALLRGVADWEWLSISDEIRGSR